MAHNNHDWNGDLTLPGPNWGKIAAIVAGMILVLALLGYGAFSFLSGNGEEGTADADAEDGFSLSARSTATPTAVPTVDPAQAHDALVEAVDRWTVKQIVGLDCVMGVCNQRVALNLTYLGPEMREAIARQDQAGKPVDTVAQRQAQLETQLQAQDHLPFLLVLNVGGRTAPVRSEMTLGPAGERLTLVNVAREQHPPSDWDDFVLDRPIPLRPNKQYRAYLFFAREEGGQPVVDFASDRSFRLELEMDESLRPDKEVIVWNFPLLGDSAGNTTSADYPSEDIPVEELIDLASLLVDLFAAP